MTDVQIVPGEEPPVEPQPVADTSRPEDLDFAALADAVDLHRLPGVQNKASASMLTTPLALAGRRYLLKLDPPLHPHLVVNEAAHLAGAKGLKIPVAAHRAAVPPGRDDHLMAEPEKEAVALCPNTRWA